MTVDRLLLWIMALGLLAGALDRILGNRWGLGKKFEEGFMALGPLALGMVGMMVLAPLLARVLSPLLLPIFRLMGADPSLFGGLLAIDMGGYHLAVELAQDPQAGLFSGVLVSATLGCTLVFSIPVGLGMLEERDHLPFTQGLLAGLVTLPLGAFFGGMTAGYPLAFLLPNLLPLLAFSLLIGAGLKTAPHLMVRGSLFLSSGLVALVTLGLAASGFHMITGVVLLPGLGSLDEALLVVGRIGVILLGTFPVLHLFTTTMKRPLSFLGKTLGMNSLGAAGLVITLANVIPVYQMMDEMTEREKVLNTAWLVSASSTLGAHLGFSAGLAPSMIGPLVITKLSGALFALLYAHWLIRKSSILQEGSDPS